MPRGLRTRTIGLLAAKQACQILHIDVLGSLHRPTYDALRAALDGASPLTTSCHK
jgi:hypothetical protein